MDEGRTTIARVFAVAAHPDDIEFLMAGTLILMRRAGCEVHYLCIANGSCGTAELERDEIVRIRQGEARAAAESIGAVYHESLVDDLEIFYEKGLLARVAALVRKVSPDVLLTHSPVDYMEDHQNAARLAVTAILRAFSVTARNSTSSACVWSSTRSARGSSPSFSERASRSSSMAERTN